MSQRPTKKAVARAIRAAVAKCEKAHVEVRAAAAGVLHEVFNEVAPMLDENDAYEIQQDITALSY